MRTVFDDRPGAGEVVMIEDGIIAVAAQNRVAVECPHVIPLKFSVI
jgi:hypothetical protein